MIASLKRLFEQPAVDPAVQQRRLALAGAALMLEVASADFALDDSERAALRRRLADTTHADRGELDDLLEEALQQHDLSTSLHEQVSLINDRFDAEEKRVLVRDLWRMAGADGILHHYEEGAIRRIAELLYVPHKDFIQTKFEVFGES